MATRPHSVPAGNGGRTANAPALLDELRRLWDPTGVLLSVIVTVPPRPDRTARVPRRTRPPACRGGTRSAWNGKSTSLGSVRSSRR